MDEEGTAFGVTIVPDEDVIIPRPRSFWQISWRVLLTPVTLAADIVTSPLQAFAADPVNVTAEAIGAGVEAGIHSARH